MICPTCGQSMESIRYDLWLPKIKRRIFNVVSSRPGIDADTIADIVYGDDVHGGPDGGRKTIHNHVHQINLVLQKAGLIIRGNRYGGYRVMKEGEGKWDKK